MSLTTSPYFSCSCSLKELTEFYDFQPLPTLLAKAFLREKIFIDWHGQMTARCVMLWCEPVM